MQADVVAVSWRQRAILIGECTWGTDRVDRQVVRDLLEVKGPRVVRDLPGAGEGWSIHYACFARRGLTDAAHLLLEHHQGLAVDAERLDRDLQ